MANYRKRWITRLGYLVKIFYFYIMGNNIPDIILQETKQLPDDLLKEVLDLWKDELTHLEDEFENYKFLYAN